MANIFELNIFESTEDVLNTPLGEEGEFIPGCPANPEQHFDKDNSGDHCIPVPGGDKEKPSAKPADGETGPKPTGSTDTPSAKPYDATNIPVPSKVTLTSDEYNDALARLQKSFKEGAEILEALQSANIVEKTVDDLQEEFVEDAILAAYEDGPLFEAVKRIDKGELKKVVKAIRKDVINYLAQNHVYVKKPGAFRKLEQVVDAAFRDRVREKMFQVLCFITASEKDLKKILKNVNQAFKEQLGEYKILAVNFAVSASVDAVYNKEKDAVGSNYFLIVDNEIPEEFKDLEKK